MIEAQLAAALELFPIFGRVNVVRTWAGVVDVTPDRSPIVGLTDVAGLYVNCGWGTGGFKATPGIGEVYADTIANDRPHPLAEPFALERFRTGALIDEHGAAGVAALRGAGRAADQLPVVRCSRRGRVLVRRPGRRGAPAGSRGRRRHRLGRVPLLPRGPGMGASESAGATPRDAGAGSPPSAMCARTASRPARPRAMRRTDSAHARVDRGRTLSFTFDGRELTGHPGDTLASALVANGVRVVARSVYLDRPRGILSAGVEEPNAFVAVDLGTHTQPSVRATSVELYDGLVARSLAGRGRARRLARSVALRPQARALRRPRRRGRPGRRRRRCACGRDRRARRARRRAAGARRHAPAHRRARGVAEPRRRGAPRRA